MDNQCQPRSLLLWTRQQQIPEVTLIKGIKIFKKVSVLTGHCSKCKALYCVDHETFGPSNARKKAYLNDAHYLKIGQSTYVDHVFSIAFGKSCAKASTTTCLANLHSRINSNCFKCVGYNF